MGKIRLDVYLAESGLAKTRSAAQAMIMAGAITIAYPSKPMAEAKGIFFKLSACCKYKM